MMSAPISAEASSRPYPHAPTFRMSLANTGSSAAAPPKMTANRSSVIAPEQHLPPEDELHALLDCRDADRARWALAGRGRSSTRHTIEMPMSTAFAPYASPTPLTAISSPPTAGPVTNPNCCTVVLTVMLFANASFETTDGNSACRAGFSNADATAITITAT